MIACYCRVSTADQDLKRQVSATRDYALDRLGADPGQLELYRDKSTGTDTARDGYKRLIDGVEAGEVEAVVVKSVSRISRSIRDLDRTVDRFTDAGVSVHFIDEGLTMDPDSDDPMQRAMFRLMGVFAELEADMIQQRTREGLAARMDNDDYHHGRAPLGFEKDDGRLVEGEAYERVVAVLDMVEKDDMSKRRAARELDTSRPTIDRALDRGELYGL